MSKFLHPQYFTVRRVGSQTWELINWLTWQGSQGQHIDVEPGFVTDFATVPWFVQWLIPKTGKWTLAATAHDKLCTLLEQRWTALQEYHRVHMHIEFGPPEPPPCEFGPVDTDGAFRAMLRDTDTDKIRRWLMWTGVRWGALRNPARRAGWWRTAHLVLPISAAVLAVVAGAALGFARVVAWAMGWL